MSDSSSYGAFAAGLGQSVRSPGVVPDPVRGAIARASAATGVDFDYLMAQARLESGLDPQANAATSSAAGLFQFTQGTWLGVLGRHGQEHGLGAAAAASSDPAMRQQVLQLRYDPDASARMAAELAIENRAGLQQTLGRAPDNTEMYLAHFLGQAGASRFLTALAADPSQSAPGLFPREAASNRAIFFDGGAPRSLGGVMDLMRAKVAEAMGVADTSYSGGSYPASFSTAAYLSGGPKLPYEPVVSQPGGPIAAEFSAARAGVPVPGPSMSETLRGAFGDNGGGSGNAGGNPLPARVAAAYEKLARFGL